MESELISLNKYISELSIIDHHCHNVVDFEKVNHEIPPLSFILSEGDSINNPKFLKQLSSTLSFKRSIKDIYNFYYNNGDAHSDNNNIESLSDEEIEKLINSKKNEIGIDGCMEMVVSKSNIECIILDDSLKFSINQNEIPLKSNEWHNQFCSKVYKVSRLETILENSLMVAKNQNLPFLNWKSYIEKLINDLIKSSSSSSSSTSNETVKTIGFKSIVAYRSGLSIENSPIIKVMEEYNRVLNEIDTSVVGSLRIENKILIDFFIHVTMGVNSTLLKPLPIQIHTGFGDSDLKLELSNPLLLKPFIEQYPNISIVLLHSSYPYCKEAGFLTWVYSNVYVDIGLSIPFLSISGMKESIKQLFHLSPIDKIIYSSDSHYTPDLFYLASKWSRIIIGDVLSKSLKNKELTLTEAKEFALKIFKLNICVDDIFSITKISSCY